MSTGFMNKLNQFNLTGENFEDECLLEVWRLNLVDEFLSYFGRWEPIVCKVGKHYDVVVEYIDNLFEKLRGTTLGVVVGVIIISLSGVSERSVNVCIALLPATSCLYPFQERTAVTKSIKVMKIYNPR